MVPCVISTNVTVAPLSSLYIFPFKQALFFPRQEISFRLEGKDLVLELADGAGLFEAEALGGLFEAADHGGRAAEENLDVVGGLGEEFLQSKLARLSRSRVAACNRDAR